MAYRTGAALILLVLMINSVANWLLDHTFAPGVSAMSQDKLSSAISVFLQSALALKRINLTIQRTKYWQSSVAKQEDTSQSLNRLTDLIFDTHRTGTVLLDRTDIYDPNVTLRA
jgi:ABC-type phosphate transport system ATPase subunit